MRLLDRSFVHCAVADVYAVQVNLIGEVAQKREYAGDLQRVWRHFALRHGELQLRWRSQEERE